MKKHLSFLILPIVMTVIIFLVFIVERLFMTSFADAGILPRTVSGLKGIFFGPLIHGDWSHLISNLSAFPVLLAMLTLVYRRNYVRIFAALYVMTGLLVWLFARPAYHIGVSGVIYALASFLFFGGIMSKRFGAMAISLLVIILYGGMVWGILPSQPHVSWESHALGAVAGFLCGLIFVKDHPKKEPKDSDYDYKIPGFYDRTSTGEV
jgi:membrane associated rhomboid family serine protease